MPTKIDLGNMCPTAERAANHVIAGKSDMVRLHVMFIPARARQIHLQGRYPAKAGLNGLGEHRACGMQLPVQADLPRGPMPAA